MTKAVLRWFAVESLLKVLNGSLASLFKKRRDINIRAFGPFLLLKHLGLLLMTIPSVGYYSALLIKSEIRDVKRFPSAKQLCSYAELVPSTYASGNTCYHGHITKQGSRWLRWILIEAAIHAVKRTRPLRRFYDKVERKKGGKVAKVATARKLLEWIYHMMRGGKTFK